MPLCGKKVAPVQKVIIPKGMINPDETTVIEIPANLHKQPIVVAKRKMGESASDVPQRPTSASGKKKSVQRRSSHGPESPTFVPLYQTPMASHGLEDYTQEPSTNYSSRPQQDHVGRTSSFNLDQAELQERMELQRNLEEFQRARRKLIVGASKLAAKNDSLPYNKCNVYKSSSSTSGTTQGTCDNCDYDSCAQNEDNTGPKSNYPRRDILNYEPSNTRSETTIASVTSTHKRVVIDPRYSAMLYQSLQK